MSYFPNLNRLILKELELRADQFARAYDNDKKSVILIPGGMGSKLLRCESRFLPDQPFPSNPAFNEIWISPASLLRGGISHIRLESNEHDWDDHPIIAAGEMNTVVKSYDKTEAFFTQNNVNYTEFGFDWRREMRAASGYLKTFLRMIKEKVMARDSGFDNPLGNATLLAHSMGGFVAKLLINDLIDDDEPTEDWFYRFVSIATPFFGAEDNMDRFYVGVKFLNMLLGGPEKVAVLAGSMPGPYMLMPPPLDIMEPHFQRLGLTRYPIRDGSDPDSEADPFNIKNRPRFPLIGGSKIMVENYFFKAEDMFQQLHRPLPDIVRQRIFHLRNNLPERQSINLEMTWENCNGAAHNFSGPSPISTNSGASDGAVPFWSARLADTPDDQVYPLRLDTSHGSLTEDPDVLDVVNGLVHGNGLPQSASASSRPRPTIADDREIENFIRDFQSGRIDDQALATASPALKRGLVQSLSLC